MRRPRNSPVQPDQSAPALPFAPQIFTYNYGKQTHAELCRWVGIEASALP
jgi:hypothetical protein